jgi:hypothetical protein
MSHPCRADWLGRLELPGMQGEQVQHVHMGKPAGLRERPVELSGPCEMLRGLRGRV